MPTPQPAYSIISADSHVLEPHDLWTTRIDARYRDRAPHAEPGPTSTIMHFEGQSTAMRPFGTPGAMWGKQTEEGRRGGWDATIRLQDMATDGVDAEVLYPSVAMMFYRTEDGGLQDACFRVYNDWLAEFCKTSPSKLVGVGLIPLVDVETGIGELRRIAKLGLRGAAIWARPAADKYSFASDRYDPFWAAVQTMDVPISLHCFTGGTGHRNPVFLANYSMSTQPVQESIATVVFSGILERFPKIKVISVENDIGWVPYLLQRMDYSYLRKGPRHAPKFASGRLPGEQFKQSVRCTFMTDRVGLRNIDLVGADVFMWSSDYPHDDSTWPNSRREIEAQFAGVSPEDKQKVIRTNAGKLYGLMK